MVARGGGRCRRQAGRRRGRARGGGVLTITGQFVIVSASNTRLVRTIADSVEERLTELGGPKPLRVEGLDDLRWVLMDYGDFVVHVFLDEARRYYELERLWNDVPRLNWRARHRGLTRRCGVRCPSTFATRHVRIPSRAQ